MAEKEIFVDACWDDEPALMGILHVNNIRGKEHFSFEYSSKWLKSARANIAFDPDLSLFGGRQHVQDKPIFGKFSDSCPDRWGRLLLNRKEVILAKKENRKPKSLKESDYLLGVYDETRMGALRLKIEEKGPYLAAEDDMPAPPWTKLRTLESAARFFEDDDRDGNEEKWLNQLLAPGSSLGGARPKASVKAPDGTLWIAKFPSRHDEWNIGAWEMVANELAKNCGINVPNAKLVTFSDKGSTFLSQRFDRANLTDRIHYASAMTMLGKIDGENASYLDIASFIRSSGQHPARDLEELWKRIVFSMAISNTDDHLRNHGFLLGTAGWKLSPAFDLNPNIYGDNLSLYVSGEDSSIDFDLAIKAASFFGINMNEAKQIVNFIRNTIQRFWREEAAAQGLSKSSISYMEPAFTA